MGNLHISVVFEFAVTGGEVPARSGSAHDPGAVCVAGQALLTYIVSMFKAVLVN